VVGVCWYEAMAFCAWLSDHLGYAITLPTEAQWEAAARGPQRRIYPWGDDWQDGRANVEEQFAGTTPVVCFASGASWCGALDMAGNVWEWTRSDFRNADRSHEVDIMENETYVSLRGGAWGYGRRIARAAIRYWNNPRDGGINLGVRLVTPLTK
jgi:formylglycine-generating enzyme required for sulfatase activity